MSVTVSPAGEVRELHYFVKLLMLGDSGVGKSCLMTRFSDEKFPIDIVGTAGIDCKEKVITASGKNIKVQIWDTAGQERYSILTESYYKKAFGVVLVYDVTDPTSFASVDSWIKSIKEKGNAVVQVMLVGNKIDLAGQQKVSSSFAAKCAASYKIPFVEASAKAGTNVDEAFLKLTESILRNPELLPLCIPAKTGVSVSKMQPKGVCQS